MLEEAGRHHYHDLPTLAFTIFNVVYWVSYLVIA